MGSRYGMRVLRSTPSQKLISAAAACACTLDPQVIVGWIMDHRAWSCIPSLRGLERRYEGVEQLLMILILYDLLHTTQSQRMARHKYN